MMKVRRKSYECSSSPLDDHHSGMEIQRNLKLHAADVSWGVNKNGTYGIQNLNAA
jgi:hypothetical protein